MTVLDDQDLVRTPVDSPLVSIVTPSFNQGRFLRATIESVLEQSYPNIEYLVVDGASKDETVSILEEYGELIDWSSEPDSGQTEAINKGLGRARGEIVGYLNSDDILLPHAIEVVVEYLDNHPECDLVYGDAEHIDEAGRYIGRYPTAEYRFERLMENCCICQPAAYWRKAAGATVGPFDESLHYAMDLDYWLRMDRSGLTLEHMPKTIAQYRLHSDAKTVIARSEILREIFSVSRNRGGYISPGYVEMWWHHYIDERPRNVARLLRPAPPIQRQLVWAHHRWLNRSSSRSTPGSVAS